MTELSTPDKPDLLEKSSRAAEQLGSLMQAYNEIADRMQLSHQQL